MKDLIFFTLFLFTNFITSAQNSSSKFMSMVTGNVVSRDSLKGIEHIEIMIPYLKMMTVTDSSGYFHFKNIPFGKYDIHIRKESEINEKIKIIVDSTVTNLGILTFSYSENEIVDGIENGLPIWEFEEHEMEGDEEDYSKLNISSVLNASRDPFLSVSAFTFGPLRYRPRGYHRNQLEVNINGLQMNDLRTGSAIWGQWGGLNDVFREQAITFGLSPGEQSLGGLLGTTDIDITALTQRKQTRVTYSLSNRTYQHRMMMTHSTGLMKNGWAISASFSKRWSKEGYIAGTFYDAYSYFFAVTKKINDKNFFHFITLGAPLRRGKAMPATQEAIDLAGNNFYNPNWGWLNGEKRNARIASSFQPLAILSYEYIPNKQIKLSIIASYQTGYYGNSALDWYHAMDPRPDYYRNLPSFHLYDPRGADPEAALSREQYYKNHPEKLQIDWERIYEANRLNYETNNGISGRRSVYVIGEDMEESDKYTFAINLINKPQENITFYTGAYLSLQNAENYRKLTDLLGGDYYVNLNQFAERTYSGNVILNQNDLNNPNGIVKLGDKYNYHYLSNFIKTYWWGQGVITTKKIDLFLAFRLSYNAYSREGMFKNGIFPEDSYGKSATQKFLTYQAKSGVTYKINGRNYLYISAGYFTREQTFDNVFFSPRTRNATVNNVQPEKIMSFESGYLIRSPLINGRLSVFATDIQDGIQIKRFYHEDYRSFVNYVMQGVNTRHIGAEFAMQAIISQNISLTGVASYMQVFYTSRPSISIYRDSDTTRKVESSMAYLNNYFLASGPQSAYTFGVNYRSPKFWYANINFNYLHRNYTDVNPSRRTADALDLIEPGSTKWHEILDQTQLPAAFTIDLFTGKSIMLNKITKLMPYGTLLNVNVGVNNILNNRNIITGSFEQLRFDYTGREPNRFPEKYFYGMGINYFINVSLKF